MAVLGDLDLDSSSPPADAMQNFCDSRFYPTARSPIESSRRAESIAHLFAVQRGFSALINFVEWEQLHRSRLTAQDLYAGLLIEIAGFTVGNSCQRFQANLVEAPPGEVYRGSTGKSGNRRAAGATGT